MKKKLYVILTVLGLIMSEEVLVKAESRVPQKDSRQLQFQDMLMVYLNETVNEDVNNYYRNFVTERVTVYPYMVNFKKIERLNGFRGYDFKVAIETVPVVGAHVPVGKDRLTYEISFLIPKKIKLLKYEHLKTEKLPPGWQYIMRNS